MAQLIKGLGAARGARGVVGLGIDLVHVPRFEHLLARHEDRFLGRAFHPSEIEQFHMLGRKERRLHFVASRWAVKEAAYKALSGAGVRVPFPEMYTTSEARGGASSSSSSFNTSSRPELRFVGRAADVAAQLGVRDSLVSISHDGEYAVAEVVLVQ